MSTTGCRLLLGQLDLMAQTYLLKQSQRGCVSIAHATALVLIKINPQVVVNINLEYIYLGLEVFSGEWAGGSAKKLH